MKRFLTFMLTLTMIVSMIVVPVQATGSTTSTNPNLLLGKLTFDSDADKPNSVGKATDFTVSNGVLNLPSTGGCWGKPTGWSFTKQTSGRLNVKFDFMSEVDIRNDSRVILTQSNQTDGNSATNLYILEYMNADNASDKVPQVGVAQSINNNGNIGKTIAGTWYTYEGCVDLDNKSVYAKVTIKTPATDSSETAGAVLGSAAVTTAKTTSTYPGYPTTADGFDKIAFVGAMGAAFHMDNLEITKSEANLLLEDDFSDAHLTASHWRSDTYSVAEGVLKRPTAKWNNDYGLKFADQNSGRLKLSFDFKLSAKGEGAILGIGATGYDDAKDTLPVLRMQNSGSGNTMSVGTHGNSRGSIPTPTVDTWYRAYSEVDLDKHSIKTVVFERETGTYLGADSKTNMAANTAHWTGWSDATVSAYNLLVTNGAVSGGISLDNIKLEKIDPNLLLEDDFSDANYTRMHLNNADNSYSVDNGVLKRSSAGMWNNSNGLTFAAQNKGKLIMEYDFSISGYDQGVIGGIGVSGQNKAQNVLAPLYEHNTAADGGKSSMSAGRWANGDNLAKIGKPEQNKIYHVRSVVDLTNKSMETTVTDPVTETQFGYDKNENMQSTEANQYWHGWSNESNLSYDLFLTAGSGSQYNSIDNLKIWHYADDATVSSDKITIKDAKGNAASGWTSVSPLIGSIAIDFGTDMKSSTITNNTIYITDKDGTKVDATVAYANGVATLTYAANTNLGGKAAYKLNISEDVVNIDGVKVKGDLDSLAFVTKAQGVFVTCGTKSEADGVITVPMTYDNTRATASNPKFIVGYYKDNVLVKCDIIDTYSLAASTLGGTESFTYTKDDAVQTDNVTLFIWDDLTNLKAVSATVEL